nr:hypothetical protein [Deltaproteobacteria bacterium]
PPNRGLSIRGQPSSGASGAAPAAAPSPATPPAQGAPSAPAPGAPQQTDKPEGSGDDASARFSLLELD